MTFSLFVFSFLPLDINNYIKNLTEIAFVIVAYGPKSAIRKKNKIMYTQSEKRDEQNVFKFTIKYNVFVRIKMYHPEENGKSSLSTLCIHIA